MSLLHRVIAVGTKPDVQELARQICNEVFVADDLVEALDIAETVTPNLAIIDDSIPPNHIHQFREALDKSSIGTRIAVLSCNENRHLQDFPQAKAHYYIHGDILHQLQEIAAQINRELQAPLVERQLTDLFANQLASDIAMVGRSKALCDVLKMAQLVASSKCNPVLILGETGTGKELVAKAIHTIRHPNEPFVDVNCAALTATLLESELFGHVKGAFTGADYDKTGFFELAGSGSIFLDEISEMPLDLQAKLLRVLQEKTFRKVGGTKHISCNATIITSSNRNLRSEVNANRFRQDLYFRLSICPITIPPLRSPERRDDIDLLAEYFLKTSPICASKSNKITAMTRLALESLRKHSWPGNVRELRNVIERAILLEITDKIGLSSIIIESHEADTSRPNTTKDFSLEKAERELISRALQETGWQKTQAAALLGITRATLYAKVKQYNLQKNSLSLTNAESSSLQTVPQIAAVG